jgi:hypothetical protein
MTGFTIVYGVIALGWRSLRNENPKHKGLKDEGIGSDVNGCRNYVDRGGLFND